MICFERGNAMCVSVIIFHDISVKKIITMRGDLKIKAHYLKENASYKLVNKV